MGLGGVAIAVLPSMIYPKQPFSDGLGGVALFYLFTFLPLKALQVGDDGLGVGSYLRF